MLLTSSSAASSPFTLVTGGVAGDEAADPGLHVGFSRKRARVDPDASSSSSVDPMHVQGLDAEEAHENNTEQQSFAVCPLPSPIHHVYLDGPVLGKFSDLMLVLGDFAFHVSKARVAAECRVLYTLIEEQPTLRTVPMESLSGNWSNHAADMHLFLQLVYDPRLAVPPSKTIVLFKMAHWLHCESVWNRCVGPLSKAGPQDPALQQLYRIVTDREIKPLIQAWKHSMAAYIGEVHDAIHDPKKVSAACSSLSSSSSSASSRGGAFRMGLSAAAPIVLTEGEEDEKQQQQQQQLSQSPQSPPADTRSEDQKKIQAFWDGLTGKATLELAHVMRLTAGGWQQLDKITPGAGTTEQPFELGQLVLVPKDIPLLDHDPQLITAIVLQTLKSKNVKVRDRLGYVRIIERKDVRLL